MNKILCVFIAAVMVLTLGLPVFSASDYSGHWAEKTIDALISENLITGDESGIRPNDSISRSEYVTIINRVFSYTSEGATVNFPDVSADKWYFAQFLAAKKAGYLTGDNLGNANPESLITRAEVAVILCRILGFKVTDTTKKFTDDSNIPSWAKDAVYALSNEGVIKGYPDGSFNADGNMTRAEAFTAVYNVKNINTPHAENSTINDRLNITTESIPSGGSSGGGGGGGGSPSNTVYEEFKLTREDSENYIVAWSTLSDASSYTVRLTSKRTSAYLEEQVTASSFNFKEMADNLTLTGRKSKEEFDVSVTAVASSGNKTANGSVYINYPAVPEVAEVITYCEPLNGEEKIYAAFDFSNLASGYEFKIDFGSGLTDVSYNKVNGKAIADITSILSEENTDEFPYTLKGISADPTNILNSEIVSGKIVKPLYFGGKGTEADPYIIKNVRHFVNIEKNNTAHFVLAEDIVLPSTYVPFEFNGVLKGDNTEDYREITVDITGASGANTGLFTQSTVAGTSVSYIALKGKVKGSGKYVGGFFGAFTIAGNISYCENYANIESTGNRCGGFAGKSSIEGALNHLVNYGNVKCTNGAGGIAGEAHGGSYLANLGNVSGGWYVGGIFGISTTNVTACFNKGNITGGYNVGGIVGCGGGSNKKISVCYNTGAVTQTMSKYSTNQAGGILGGVSGASAVYSLSSCYNTGAVTPAAGGFIQIFPVYDPQSNMTASDCVYLSETLTDDQMSGTTAVTAAQLKTYSFTNDLLSDNSATSYPYPEIKDFADIVIPVKLSTPSVTSVTANRDEVTINISGQAETTKYKLVISKNPDFSNAVSVETENGGSAVSENIISYLSDYDTYYVKITAIGNGAEWMDSDSVQTTCQKPYYQLSTPSATVSRPESTVINLEITGQAETESYKIIISENSDFSDGEELTAQGGASATVDVSSYISQTGIKYYIKVEAIADGILWNSSEAFATEYTKEAYKLSTPALLTEPYFANGGYNISWNEITSSNLTGYTLTVKDSSEVDVYTDTVPKTSSSVILSETSEMPFGENTYTVILVANATSDEETSTPLTFTIDTRFGGGLGTSANPYYISNATHFKNIALDNDAYYELRDNIDLRNCGYAPIEEFNGSLGSYNNELRTITAELISDANNFGLFAKAENATFKYIKLEGSVESTKNSTLYQTGGFVAKGFGQLTFISCVNNADITTVKTKAGGFVGNGEIIVLDNCTNNGNVTISNGNNAGGFVGKADVVYNNNSVNNGVVTASSNYGDIAGSGTVTAGLPLSCLVMPDDRRRTVV